MNHQETIRNIKDINSLSAVITSLVEKSGLTDVLKLSENVISAVEKNTLRSKTIKFVYTLSELNGKVSQILSLVEKHTIASDDIIIITSNKKKISEYFKKWLISETKNTKFEFWHEEHLIEKINDLLPEYWGHNDLFLKSYEDSFLLGIEQEADLKQILKLDNKFENFLNIFIEPKIYFFKEDKQTERKVRVKVNIEHLLRKENFILSGDAGTGKSTLLKEIGKKAIKKNMEAGGKTFPIYIKTGVIANNNFSIEESINEILSNKLGKCNIEKIYSDYHVLLLIDSIDEFEKAIRESILGELARIVDIYNINFILSTRNYDNLTKDLELCEHIHIFLNNFDLHQVKLYLDNFFKFDLVKSNELWENLLDNHILERIPVTPLTISLISILYEQNGYEVPATLTDVYDNFNIFLLGRLSVQERLDFLEINVKEKILSMYALKIIRTPNRLKLDEKHFIEYVLDYFSNKSITIEEAVVPELIINLTEGTGVLYIDEAGFISYKHDHFMEYYASKEIFNLYNRHELENELIQNFTEFNWQNTAIFYAGRTKEMPEFLGNLIQHIKQYTQLNECLLAISGMGYILQSLWMTDSKVRKDGVVASLELLLRVDVKVKQLAESKFNFFDGIRDVDIALMNL